MPKIQIFDPAEIQAILDRANFNPLFSVGEPSAEECRMHFLSAMALDPRNGERDLLTVDAAIMMNLQALVSAAPNFADPAGVVLRAATSSFLTGAPLAFPPMLLLGPPGVGKSFFARRLADAIGAPLVEHAMNIADDPGVLVGHSASWRAARAGLLARTLIERSSASPIVFVDEIDKPLWTDHGDPLDVFHSLLEPENARRFTDAYIAEAPIRADKVLWIATANDVSKLKPSLLDRFLTLTIELPDKAGRERILRTQFLQALATASAPLEQDLDVATLATLGEATPRQARLIFDLAVASAVSAQQHKVTADDICMALRLLGGTRVRQKIGF